MKYTKTKSIAMAALIFSMTLALCVHVGAACDNLDNAGNPIYRVSYPTYEQSDTLVAGRYDTRCDFYTTTQGLRCKIKLNGILYRPLAPAYTRNAAFPAIIVNHGSGVSQPSDEYCEIAEYYIPKGYIVFVPFRRGQGGGIYRSTGGYIEDIIDDYANNINYYIHLTNCSRSNGGCYRAQLFDEQANEDVRSAMEYLKQRADVKTDPGAPNDHRIAIMGSSYGGAVTVFANSHALGHKVAVAFSPGAQQWSDEYCAPFDLTCGTAVQRALISAASRAEKAAFYLQARWDHDTRSTIDLAYAHSYGGAQPTTHSRGWNAAIFPYTYPCDDTPEGNPCSYDELQSIHRGFVRDPKVWGPAVTNFLKRYDVKL